MSKSHKEYCCKECKHWDKYGYSDLGETMFEKTLKEVAEIMKQHTDVFTEVPNDELDQIF